MPAGEGHPWFAAIYDRLNAAAERGFLRPARTRVAGGARGRVLEIGCGTGAAFPYYGEGVQALIATEPDPCMLTRARRRATDVARQIDLQKASAEALPFPDASFDTVVAMLVLCTVTDPARALTEIRRVLKPGGTLRFYEHVRHGHAPGALAQDLVAPLWARCFGGCRPNRNTAASIAAAGLQIVELEAATPVPPIPPFWFIRPQILGVAQRV